MEKQPSPPRWADRFLGWLLPSELYEELLGDLHEQFAFQAEELGAQRARWMYFFEVLRFCRPYFLRRRFSAHSKYSTSYTYSPAMIRNYFIIAWRNILKNKAFSVINITGLSIGLTCSLLIYLWVKDELQIDTFHERGDRIYTVTSKEFIDGKATGYYDTPGLLGEELKRTIPEVELSCNWSGDEARTFAVKDKKLKFIGGYSGEDFFKIFSYPFLQGTVNESLKTRESISISEKMAIALFGSAEKAINQSIKFDNYKDLTIKAVYANMPESSSLKLDYLISWELFKEREPWVYDWDNSGPGAFVLLKKNADEAKVNAKLKHFIGKFSKGYKTENNHLELGIQPFKETYLNSRFENGETAGGRIDYVKLFTVVAIIILLIACINFMNLSIAQSLKRAKEIGVRKAIGAEKSSLVGQFMGEAFMFSVIALFFALTAAGFILPSFNSFTNKQIALPYHEPSFWLFIFGLLLLVGLLSGLYPSLFLTAFRPIAVLKNNLKVNQNSISLRKGLVIFQFTLSTVFIIGTLIISKQINFIHSKNIGYEKQNLIYLPVTGTLSKQFEVFENELKKIDGVESLSKISNQFISNDNTTGSVEWQGKNPNSSPNFNPIAVEYNFVNTMKATLLQGRDFSREFADSTSYIINEAALKIIGYKSPIGMPLTFWGKTGQIIGVVKDFHFNSMLMPIEPMIIRHSNKLSHGYCLIRIEGERTQEALNGIETIHKKLNPDFPFTYKFVEAEFENLYKTESLVKSLSIIFAILAIAISCLGLLGLVMFVTEQRTKEIGIRKVLGATVTNIWTLILKDFAVLVIVSCLIAAPIAYYFMNNWLQKYSYRTEINWWIFVAAGAGALVTTLLTVSFQTIKAALMNPVKSLKSE
ncbi:permease prefix domain 2-containing transporter [Runella sp. MFBS21]|uniref:FtsX-like permease family protein n=1 Tax=Runella sp. MFBS21 TaxID=3034018 RepID=UPI0023F8E652|nr:FtsX-like permease family protein [Runella sp. MFBS21]MDF7815968.1 permease prefix domain 2-containing transporter [Runella sp. MFBS21]